MKRLRSRLRLAALLALAMQLAGCQNLGPTLQAWQEKLLPAREPETAAQASTPTSRELREGAFQRGQIHCQVGDCSDGWTLTVPARGLLRLEVYAPVGDAVPAFEVGLEDAAGTSLRRAPPAARSPRRLSKTLPAGTYRVVIASVGDHKGPLTYDVVYQLGQPAKTEATRKPRSERSGPRPAEGAGSAPDESERSTDRGPAESGGQAGPPAPPVDVPAQEPRETVIRAEVIGVDQGEAGATRVWLDRGRPDGFTAGTTGALVEDGRRIGRFVVVESYETGSVANVTGRLRGEISERTVAEIPTASGAE